MSADFDQAREALGEALEAGSHTFLGKKLGFDVEVRDAFRSPDHAKLFQSILQELPKLLPLAEAALKKYEEDEPDSLSHIDAPYIWVNDEQIVGQWSIVAERDDWDDYGWHIEFEGAELRGVWAGD